MKRDSFDLIRRYLDDDVTTKEREFVQTNLRESESFRKSFERVDGYLSSLRHLSSTNPPDRVWRYVANAIHTNSYRSWWYSWIYYRPTLAHASTYLSVVGMVCIALFASAQLGMFEPNYEIIPIKNAHGFVSEAETYYLHNDLNRESSEVSERLIAFYYSDMPE